LAGIGAGTAPLTITLLWNAAADLDLYFSCPDGTEIGWETGVGTTSGDCQGRLDHDMREAGKDTTWDGATYVGQVENISVGAPVQDLVYHGRIHYYAGSENAECRVIFSGTDADGHLHVYGQHAAAEFTSGMPEYNPQGGPSNSMPYSFTYADPDA